MSWHAAGNNLAFQARAASTFFCSITLANNLTSSHINRSRQYSSMSLFGNTQPGNQARSSLFGGGNNTQQGSSLFGNNQPQQQPQQQTGSLFGGGNNQTQQQPQQQNGSLFGPNLAQQQLAQQQHPTQQGTFASAIGPVPGMNNSTPQQQNNSNLGNSNAPYSLNPLNQSTGQELAAHRLGQSNLYNRPNEKTVPAQVQTLIRKWDPQSQDTKLQSYLYNAVSSSYAPFYYRNVEEDEGDWEEALRNKPLPVEKDGESVSFVPVLVRGFHALGERVEYQAKTVNEMRARLHEMNNRQVSYHRGGGC